MDTRNEQEAASPLAMTDREIITRVIAGEKELYAWIIRRYNQRLYRVAMSIVADESEAEDVMQVSYIKAWENLAKFNFESAFATWITRILINESLLRVKKRKAGVVLRNEETDISPGMAVTAEKQNPLGKMMNVELKTILEQSIRELPDKYRAVFVLREIENLNVGETGECLSLTETNVKVRLNRAKAMLKKSLDKYYSKEDIFHFHLRRCDIITDAVMNHINNLH